jgi:hypothetical protein
MELKNDPRFKNLEIFDDKIDDWYTKLRRSIERDVVSQCITLGIPLVKKSNPIGRLLCQKISLHLIKTEQYARDFYICNNYHGVGQIS